MDELTSSISPARRSERSADWLNYVGGKFKLRMPAKSKQQQKFFGVVKAMKDGDIPKEGRAGEVADNMTKKEIDKYASTKHKGLPKKVKEQFKLFTFEDFVNEMEVSVNPGMNVPGMGHVTTPGVGDGSVGSGDRMDMGPKKKKKKDEEEELEVLDISVERILKPCVMVTLVFANNLSISFALPPKAFNITLGVIFPCLANSLSSCVLLPVAFAMKSKICGKISDIALNSSPWNLPDCRA